MRALTPPSCLRVSSLRIIRAPGTAPIERAAAYASVDSPDQEKPPTPIQPLPADAEGRPRTRDRFEVSSSSPLRFGLLCSLTAVALVFARTAARQERNSGRAANASTA